MFRHWTKATYLLGTLSVLAIEIEYFSLALFQFNSSYDSILTSLGSERGRRGNQIGAADTYPRGHHDNNDGNHYRNITRKEDVILEGIEMSYLMEVAIGSIPQYFALIVDTGSCDTWVADRDCYGFACKWKKRYDHGSSSTTSGPLDPFQIRYLDNDWITGRIYSDHLYIGRSQAENFSFGGAKHIEGSSMEGRFDGIMALCPKGTSWPGGNLIENLYSTGEIKNKQFSIWMSTNPDEGGKLILGRVAEEYTISDIFWFKNGRRDKWGTVLHSFRFGDEDELVNKKAAVVLDTGCTNIFIPERAANLIHKKIGAWFSPSANAYAVECDEIWTFPTITMAIGGLEIELKPIQYIMVQDHGCFSAFDDRDVIRSGVELWILGVPFHRAYFTSYDMEARRFGIAFSAMRRRHRPMQCKIEE